MNHIEKYIRLNMDFPNKAGKLHQVVATQKRLVEKLLQTKQSPEVQELLISVAEGYDVTLDLLGYMKTTLQEVANDSDAIIEGSRLRNVIDNQNEFISDLIASRDSWWEAKLANRKTIQI